MQSRGRLERPLPLWTLRRSRWSQGRKRDAGGTTYRSEDVLWARQVDHDIKIYSLLDRDAHKTTTSTKGNPLGDHITSQALRWLETIEKRNLARAPASLAILRPLVFSPGGLVAKSSWEELGKWKEGLGTLRWQRLLSQISLELLRAKGRLFEM